MLMVTILLPSSAFCQLFKMVPGGMILVKDSITDKQITDELYPTAYMEGEAYPYLDYWLEEHQGEYHPPKLYADSMIVAKTKTGWGLMTVKGLELVPFKYKFGVHLHANNTLYAVDEKDNAGNWEYKIYSFSKKLIVKYGQREEINDKMAIFKDNKTGYIGIISNDLDTLLPFEYSYAQEPDYDRGVFGYSNYLVLRSTTGEYGAVDWSGKTRLPFEYSKIELPIDQHGTATNRLGHWLIDSELNIIYTDDFTEYVSCEEGNAVPAIIYSIKKNAWIALDTAYKPIPQAAFEYLEPYFSCYYGHYNGTVGNQGKYGVYNFQQKSYSIPCEYDTILKIDDLSTYRPIFACKKAKSVALYNDSLRLLGSFEAEDLFNLGYFPYLVQKNKGQYSFLSFAGKKVSQDYDLIAGMDDSYITALFVGENGKFGWVNKSLEAFIPVEYDCGCPQTYKKYDEKTIAIYPMLKGDWIYYFDESGKLWEKKAWNHFDNFCK